MVARLPCNSGWPEPTRLHSTTLNVSFHGAYSEDYKKRFEGSAQAKWPDRAQAIRRNEARRQVRRLRSRACYALFNPYPPTPFPASRERGAICPSLPAGRDYKVGSGRYLCAVPCTLCRACGVHNTLQSRGGIFCTAKTQRARRRSRNIPVFPLRSPRLCAAAFSSWAGAAGRYASALIMSTKSPCQ